MHDRNMRVEALSKRMQISAYLFIRFRKISVHTDTEQSLTKTLLLVKLSVQKVTSSFSKRYVFAVHTTTWKRSFQNLHPGHRFRKAPFTLPKTPATCGRKAKTENWLCVFKNIRMGPHAELVSFGSYTLLRGMFPSCIGWNEIRHLLQNYLSQWIFHILDPSKHSMPFLFLSSFFHIFLVWCILGFFLLD